MAIKRILLDCTDFQQIYEKYYNADTVCTTSLTQSALILRDLLPLSKRLVYTINCDTFLIPHFNLLFKPIFLPLDSFYSQDWLFWERLISSETGPLLWESFDPTGGSTPFQLKLKGGYLDFSHLGELKNIYIYH